MIGSSKVQLSLASALTIGIVAGVVFFRKDSGVLLEASQGPLVWCCMGRSGACAGNVDPAACVNQGGAFSRERDLCDAACATLTALNDAQSPQ
jgi:hypothetical protein